MLRYLYVMILLVLLLSSQPVPQTPPDNIPPEKIAPAQHDPLFEHLSHLPDRPEPASEQEVRVPK